MTIFHKIFRQNSCTSSHTLPTTNEIIDQMQNRGLPDVPSENLRIFPSPDRTKRILIIKNPTDYYTICYEQLCFRDEDELRQLSHLPHILPAWWEPVDSPLNTKSFYGTYEEALKEILSFTDYRQYFL